MNKKCHICGNKSEKSRCKSCRKKENEKQKYIYNERLSKNLCPKCGDKPAEGNKCCKKCVVYIVEKDKRVRLKRFNNNLCVLCGQRPPDEGFKCCRACVDIRRKTTELRHSRLKDLGLCTLCGKNKSLENIIWCSDCHLKNCSLNNLGSKTFYKDLLQILEKQKYICPYTGDKIIIGTNDSIDHILPSGKFPELKREIKNLQWVSRDVNKMKWDHTEEEFKILIKKIHDHLKL
jgi:hypothetical protein